MRPSDLLIVVALWVAPAAAQTATDGDSLRINGQAYRLQGIDAPELAQTCGTYPAGVESRNTLSGLIQGRAVACEHVTTDRFGRSVAYCRAGGLDLGAEMVRRGMAWAFVRYSREYVQLESQARAQGLGVHAQACEKAWEYRARLRAVR